MKLDDQIRQSIITYPSLFKCKTYEESRLAVLDHMLLVYGTGYEWVNKTKKEKGGYLTDNIERYKKGPNEGEYKPFKDYGKETFEEFSPNYFENKIYYIQLRNNKSKLINVRERPEREYGGKKEILLEFSGIEGGQNRTTEILYPYLTDHPVFIEAVKARWDDLDYFFVPREICEYSPIMELYRNNYFVQPDWLKGFIDVAKAALDYYNNPEQYKHDFNYPSEQRAKRYEVDFAKKLQSEGEKGLQELKKIWGFKGEETPMEHMVRVWDNKLIELKDFYTKFLSKYE